MIPRNINIYRYIYIPGMIFILYTRDKPRGELQKEAHVYRAKYCRTELL